MSFLLRRSKALVLAGWYDDFTSYPVGNIVAPWVHLADGSTATINSSAQLVLPSNFSSTNGGGESYEWQPFTPNWGIDINLTNAVSGAAAQQMFIMFTDSWTEIGGAFQNMAGIALKHAPAAGGDTIVVYELPQIFASGTTLASWTSPVAYGGTLTVRIWVDDDQYLRVFVNGTYVGGTLISSSTYKFGPNRRCIRTLNECLNSVLFNTLYHYDRATSFPANVWSQTFHDNLTSSGGGWTQIGSGGALSGSGWQQSSSSDGSNAIIRDTGNTSLKQRVTATVSGTPTSSADAGLMLGGNSTGTNGYTCNFYSNAVYISEYTTSLSGNPPTMHDFASNTNVTISNGDVLTFSIYGDYAWVEQNGNRICYAGTISPNSVPSGGSWGGARVSHKSSNYSSGFSDITFYSGI